MNVDDGEWGIEAHFDGIRLTQHPRWSTNGAIDLRSAEGNPEAAYLVEAEDVHLYRTSKIADRHGKINYLTFGGAVEKESLEWLEGQIVLRGAVWKFEYVHGGHNGWDQVDWN